MFFQPKNWDEALEIRRQHGGEVTPIGGGTDIVVAMNRDAPRRRQFLDLTHMQGYSDLRRDNGCYVAAGGVSFSQLGRLPIPAVSQASLSVGGPAIRNRGTMAGNFGTASPAGDGCVAMLALPTEIELSHATRGKRTISIDDYFVGFRKTALLADELITQFRFPSDWRTAWYKIGKRASINISLVCCAVGVSPKGQVRVAFGCVAPTVIRAKTAEGIIEKSRWEDAAIEAAAEAAMTDVSPIDDHRASAAYKRAMTGVLARRLLRGLRLTVDS